MANIKILAYPDPSAARLYRIEQPFKYLNRMGGFECVISPTEVRDEQLLWADIVFVKHLIDPKMIATLWAYKMERGKIIVTDRDDLLTIVDSSPLKKAHVDKHTVAWSEQLLDISNHVICSTEVVEKEVKQFNPNTTIIPNYLDMEMWDFESAPNETGKIRIGWLGSMTHHDDLMLVLPVIKKILMERDNVKFIYCHDEKLKHELRDIPHDKWEEVYAMSDYYRYPQFAHTFSFDIAIAPLVDIQFNRAKSYLKYLEYGICGYPGIYSPAAYSGVIEYGKNGLLAYNLTEWEEALNLLLDNPKLRNSIRKEARRNVRRQHSIASGVSKYAQLFRTLQERSRTSSSLDRSTDGSEAAGIGSDADHTPNL